MKRRPPCELDFEMAKNGSYMGFAKLTLGFVVTVLTFSALPCHESNAQEPATPLFRIVRKAVVCNNSDRHLETAGVVRCKNGDLLVAFFTQDGLYTVRSKDEGNIWQKP